MDTTHSQRHGWRYQTPLILNFMAQAGVDATIATMGNARFITGANLVEDRDCPIRKAEKDSDPNTKTEYQWN